jgi:hypothetical protein
MYKPLPDNEEPRILEREFFRLSGPLVGCGNGGSVVGCSPSDFSRALMAGN